MIKQRDMADDEMIPVSAAKQLIANGLVPFGRKCFWQGFFTGAMAASLSTAIVFLAAKILGR